MQIRLIGNKLLPSNTLRNFFSNKPDASVNHIVAYAVGHGLEFHTELVNPVKKQKLINRKWPESKRISYLY